MSAIIYYFSGTGNSLKVARELTSQIKDARISSISKAKGSQINANYDKIGFVFPVYMWGLPLIVAEFLKLFRESNKYYFAVCTFGGFQGGTLEQAAEILKSNGLKLSAGFGIRMPGNYAPMYGAIPESKQKKYFAAANEKIKKIAEAVNEAKESSVEKNIALVNWLFSKKFYVFGSAQMHMMDKKFWTDEKCDSCGICEKVCPVKNIKIIAGKPVWGNNCEQCMACFQWCPVEAIQYAKSTIGRKRYRHPDAKVNDFIMER